MQYEAMSRKSRFVAFLLAILVFFPKSETANITAFISKSASPSYAVEGKNFTLEWNYTLDGTIGSVQFAIANEDGTDTTIGRGFSPGIVSVQGGFQARFKAQATETRAELTILAVQRSDEETYKLIVLPTGTGSISKTVVLSVNFAPENIKITGNTSVIEGESVNLDCSAGGKPRTNITWTRLSDGSNFTMPLINISRDDVKDYRCTADNGVGTPATRNVTIDVQYKPDNVSLSANTTENTNCSDLLWVNLTCEAFDANPSVEMFQLLKNGEILDTRNNRTWIREISKAGEHVYSCRALHFLGNVTSSDKTVTFNVLGPISVFASGNEILNEGGSVALHCKFASAHPEPTITWSKVNADDFAVSVVGSNNWLNFSNIRRDKAGDYICIANNICGKRKSSRRAIDVQFAPENASLSTNVSTVPVVCVGMVVNFTCAVEATNPAVDTFTLYENGSVISKKADSGVWLKTLDTGGVVTYRCQANNSVGTSSSSNKTRFSIEVSASATVESNSIVVKEGQDVYLVCNGSGLPSPNISWVNLYNVVMENGRIWSLDNISRTMAGQYTCVARNSCGSDSQKVDIVVQYRTEATGPGENATVAEGDVKTLTCPVDGNPNPGIEWYSEKIGRKLSKGKRLEARESGCYTCVASNNIGPSVNITHCLSFNASHTTVPPSKILPDASHTTVPPSKILPGREVEASLITVKSYLDDYRSLDSDPSKEFVAWFEEEMDKIYLTMPEYNRTKVTNLRPGSVIVYFILYFKTAVSPEKGIENLRVAISSNGTFGDFEAKDLRLLSDESTMSTTPGSHKPSVSATPSWAIIVAVAGGVVFLAILVGVLTWWVHKQRKCRKDTKIHNSDMRRHDDEGWHSQVQGAYAQSGPPAANGTDGAAEQEIEAEAAIPTYAAVDKSKKSKKQADERPPEYAVVDKSKKKETQEAAAIPTYAEVDKSKKKNKSREEVPAVYAEVDKSKKKKKKKIDDKNLYENLDEPKKEKKPGELLYADLGDFQNPSMPTVSTSPQPLPAIKKADPYERTDYADITQFLKGNATLPPNDGNGDTEMKPKRPSKNKIQGNDKETPI